MIVAVSLPLAGLQYDHPTGFEDQSEHLIKYNRMIAMQCFKA